MDEYLSHNYHVFRVINIVHKTADGNYTHTQICACISQDGKPNELGLTRNNKNVAICYTILLAMEGKQVLVSPTIQRSTVKFVFLLVCIKGPCMVGKPKVHQKPFKC